MTNPLERYFRQPKLYVRLPSQGQYYQTDDVETSLSGEVAIYAMSVMDQIAVKTPDALLNGEALLKVIKNCAPGIKNPKQLVEPDINSVLLAIRIASLGPDLELETKCPNCGKDHTFGVDLGSMLECQTDMPLDDHHVELGSDLVVHVRPYNFRQRHLSLLNELEETKTVTLLNSNQSLDETQKMTQLGDHVTRMAERTFDILSESITAIDIVPTQEQVTNTDHIKEFIKGIPQSQAQAIIDKVKDLNRSGLDTGIDLACDACGHKWNHTLDFDPTSFFG